MEMKIEKTEVFKQGGQVMNWGEFEDDFLKQSFEGIKLVSSNGQVRRDVEYDEIINELDRRNIKDIQYIESQIAVKIFYIDGKYDVLYRE
jgi:hypothetical protein